MIKFYKYIVFFISIFFLYSCDDIGRSRKSHNSAEGNPCIEKIEIVKPPLGREEADLLEITIISSDLILNNALDSSKVEKLIFKEQETSADSVITHHVRVKKLANSSYKLSFMTSFYINSQKGSIEETASIFKKTALVILTIREGVQLTIGTCKNESQ